MLSASCRRHGDWSQLLQCRVGLKNENTTAIHKRERCVVKEQRRNLGHCPDNQKRKLAGGTNGFNGQYQIDNTNSHGVLCIHLTKVNLFDTSTVTQSDEVFLKIADIYKQLYNTRPNNRNRYTDSRSSTVAH